MQFAAAAEPRGHTHTKLHVHCITKHLISSHILKMVVVSISTITYLERLVFVNISISVK